MLLLFIIGNAQFIVSGQNGLWLTDHLFWLLSFLEFDFGQQLKTSLKIIDFSSHKTFFAFLKESNKTTILLARESEIITKTTRVSGSSWLSFKAGPETGLQLFASLDFQLVWYLLVESGRGRNGALWLAELDAHERFDSIRCELIGFWAKVNTDWLLVVARSLVLFRELARNREREKERQDLASTVVAPAATGRGPKSIGNLSSSGRDLAKKEKKRRQL